MFSQFVFVLKTGKDRRYPRRKRLMSSIRTTCQAKPLLWCGFSGFFYRGKKIERPYFHSLLSDRKGASGDAFLILLSSQEKKSDVRDAL